MTKQLITALLAEDEVAFLDTMVKESARSGERLPLTGRSDAIRRLIGKERLLSAMREAALREAEVSIDEAVQRG